MGYLAAGVVAVYASQRNEHHHGRNPLNLDRNDVNQRKGVVGQQRGGGHNNGRDRCRSANHGQAHRRLKHRQQVIAEQEYDCPGQRPKHVNTHEAAVAQIFTQQLPEPVHVQHIEQDVEKALVRESIGHQRPGVAQQHGQGRRELKLPHHRGKIPAGAAQREDGAQHDEARKHQHVQQNELHEGVVAAAERGADILNDAHFSK